MNLRIFFFLWTVVFLLAGTASRAQDTVYLDKPDARPYLTVFRAASNNVRAAVIICSGGSYGRTADLEEGLPAAKLLTANGITVFLLDYRLPKGDDKLPLADAQAALAYARANTGKYRIKEDQVGMLGFSAGGHLVSTIGTHSRQRYGDTPAGANLRPDFMVLVYPVISMADSLTHLRSRQNFLGISPTKEKITAFSNELQVTDQTPPAFIVAAVDDAVVNVDNSLYFSAALKQHRVKTDLFLYTAGGHGFGINNRMTGVQWTDSAINWIKTGVWKTK